jgi:Na+/H+-dicarboxylate symporter
MEARPYRRAPKSFVAAMVFGGAALALLVFGLVLDALPEHGVGEWNGLPLGEYGTGDLLPTIIPLSFGALVFSAVALRRGPALGRWQRWVLIGFVVAAGLAVAYVLLAVAFAWLLCHNGCN